MIARRMIIENYNGGHCNLSSDGLSYPTRSDEGCLIVDAHQRTNVPRLYAAGDMVRGLHQISHAMGEGGVAATTIRNDLASEHALLRAMSPR